MYKKATEGGSCLLRSLVSSDLARTLRFFRYEGYTRYYYAYHENEPQDLENYIRADKLAPELSPAPTYGDVLDWFRTEKHVNIIVTRVCKHITYADGKTTNEYYWGAILQDTESAYFYSLERSSVLEEFDMKEVCKYLISMSESYKEALERGIERAFRAVEQHEYRKEICGK